MMALVVAGLAIAVLVCVFVGVRDVYRSIVLTNRGTVTPAQVLFVRYGSRADTVQVHLPPPGNRNVELVAWNGHPRVGQTISVRYDTANPGLAEGDGAGLWEGITLVFGVAAFFSLIAWWEASGYRERRDGLRWLRRPRWLPRPRD
jgi:hypothetical protein